MRTITLFIVALIIALLLAGSCIGYRFANAVNTTFDARNYSIVFAVDCPEDASFDWSGNNVCRPFDGWTLTRERFGDRRII